MLGFKKFLRIRNPRGPIDLVHMFVHKKSLIYFLAKNAKTHKANRFAIFQV